MGQLANWWLSRYKPSTQQTYATYLPRWTAWRAGRRLDPLAARRADVELWLHEVADSGLSRASIAGHYDAIASIYRPALEENRTEVDPCARIPQPKVLRELQRREVLTVLEHAAFLTAARALGPTHHAIAVLGGMLGLRASEVASLTVESLTTVRGYVVLTFVGKGDKPARAPVPLPALPAVQAAVDGRTIGPHALRRTVGTVGTPPTRSPASSPAGPADPAGDVRTLAP